MKIPPGLLVFLGLALAACGGRAADPPCQQDARSDVAFDMPTRAAPSVGESLTSCYGATVTRLTDHARDGAAFIQADYSTQSHLNADGTLLALERSDGRVRVLDRASRQWRNVERARAQNPVWHPLDPRLLLYTSTENGAAEIRSLDVASGVSTVELRADAYASLDGLGEADISPDGNRLVFLGTTRSNARHVLTYHRDTRRLAASVLDVTRQRINWVQVTNTRVLVAYELDPTSCAPDIAASARFYRRDAQGQAIELEGCQPLRVFDTDMRPAWPGGQTLLAPYWGHGDVGLDKTDGNREVWVMTNASSPIAEICPSSFVRLTLDQPGGAACLRGGDPAFSWDLAAHVALPAAPSAWAYVSFYRTRGDAQYPPCAGCTVPFQNEIVRLRLDGTGFERLTHHHSSRFLPSAPGGGYNWQPRASVDPTGRFVLFNSNFGSGESELVGDVYLLALPEPGV